jgi:NADH-quinone oxidoreductase subunit G
LLATGAPLATAADLYKAATVLIIGADLSQQHPFLAYQVRANVRHHGARVYVVNPSPTREENRATGVARGSVEELREVLVKETDLVVVFGDSVQGEDVRGLVAMLPATARYVCLVDYANSRGAFDMGLVPDAGGMNLDQMIAAPLDFLWVVGANPLENTSRAAGFLLVQELFLTETALQADVVLPAAAAYEKTGSFTNTCGEVQRLKKGPATPGVKADLEIVSLIARRLGFELAAPLPEAVFEEIRRTVPGYDISYASFISGGAVATRPSAGRAGGPSHIRSSRDTLFQSGTLGRYCGVLQSVREKDAVEVRV